MVEFALVLPVLLTLLYGMLETGRLLFIYASTVTAARQAVRYGSATGDSPNGRPYYMDCNGIEAAARQVGFINTFENVTISYDGGLDSNNGNPLPLDPADPACGNYTDANVQNGDRIIVEVTAQWVPIVSIVPLEPFTITSQSYRTILASVAISVTAVPQGWSGSGSGILYLDVTALPNPYSSVEQTITYSYKLTNTGTGTLSGPFSVTGNIAASNCTGAPATLEVNASFTCTGTYQITQPDLDTGSVKNTVTALANGSPSNQVIKIITASQLPELALSKSASPTATSRVGKTITYTYILTNTGNVTLSGPFTVFDNQIPVDCSGNPASLAPGGTATCTGTDVVTEHDIDVGTITNTATASAIYDSSTISSNTVTVTVLTPPIILEVFAPSIVTTPGPATYTYKVTNDTDFPATSVVINDNKVTIDGSCPVTVPANSSITCTGVYTFTQAEIDSGAAIISTTVVNGVMNSKNIASNPITVTVSISQSKQLTAALSATPSNSPMETGDTILYTYTLTNTGNVTLRTPISVTDITSITCSDQSDFAPGASPRTCTGTYTVTSTDITAGSVTNNGVATAIFNNNGTPETISSENLTTTVPTFDGPRFDITISADLPPGNSLPTIINYTYTITNTGGVTLSNYNITTSLPTDTIDCSLASPTLALGGTTTCTGFYTVNTTGNITNTITAASTTEAPTANNIPQSVTTSVFYCNTSTVTLSHSNIPDSTIVWTITNNSGDSLNLSEIKIVWPTNRRLQSITFASPTNTIWSGSPGDNSGNRTFGGLSLGINNGSSATVTVVFNNSANVSDFTVKFSQPACSSSVFKKP